VRSVFIYTDFGEEDGTDERVDGYVREVSLGVYSGLTIPFSTDSSRKFFPRYEEDFLFEP
jgi:hypothetical protein